MTRSDRNTGLDMYRILCCIGVLTYHIMDDVLGKSGGVNSRPIYFAASYCVPGFFLLSGYLLGMRNDLSMEYIEGKICDIVKKLFAWVVFWVAVHYVRTGEMYDLWGNVTAGASSGGILPVAWFLFTYCLLMLLGYPAWHFLKRKEYIFCGLSLIWAAILAFGFDRNMVNGRPQSLWLHLYAGYFCLGLSLSRVLEWLNIRLGRKASMAAAVIGGVSALAVYAFRVKEAKIFLAPHNYYGEWFYSIWLVCMFWVFSLISVENDIMKNMLKRMADNTFAVYLGHLPILLYITAAKPLETTWMALVFIGGFFIGLELLAELFRKMPLLRSLV